MLYFIMFLVDERLLQRQRTLIRAMLIKEDVWLWHRLRLRVQEPLLANLQIIYQ